MIVKKEICYLNNEFIYFSNNDKKAKLDIIISPYYFWYFRQKLPVANKKLAKKIASEFFANRLDNNIYEFLVFPTDEKNVFEVYALNLNAIYDKLKSFDIDKNNISSISFPQKEFENIKIELDNTYLVVDNDYAFEISKSKQILTNIPTTNIKDVLKGVDKLKFRHQLSKGGTLENLFDFVDNNFINIAILIVLVSLSFVANIIIDLKQIKMYDTKQQEIMSKQKYAEHSIQLEYVKKNYQKLDKDEVSFRKKFNKATSIVGNNNVFVNTFSYEKGIFSIEIVADNKASADAFVAPIGANYISSRDNKFNYEIK